MTTGGTRYSEYLVLESHRRQAISLCPFCPIYISVLELCTCTGTCTLYAIQCCSLACTPASPRSSMRQSSACTSSTLRYDCIG